MPGEMDSAAPTPSPSNLTRLPWLLALALLVVTACPRVHEHDHLLWTMLGASAGLVGWFVALRLSGRAMAVVAIKPIKQHYIQASVQLVLYLYWGFLWQDVDGSRPIYLQTPLILAQFCYLYAFDGLWSWTRGRAWRLSSGPTPIVLSTNLFIWFRDDFFIWQLAMVTAGLLGKEFLRWNKDGRRTHIFNPSGFGLMCAATVLILLGETDATWAKPLSTTIAVPGIFLVIFALGLIVQHFFAVTLMTFAAALAMIATNLVYEQVTGVYLFISTNLPAAAFLGLMLLMTDPSTSPRTNVGRTLFGLGYGLGYIVAFELLNRIGAPDLYAKLYPVPVLNLTVQALDRFARSGVVGRWNARWEQGVAPRVSNAVHMALWATLFASLFASGYFGREHPGASIAFWKRAVSEERANAARGLVKITGSRAVDPMVDESARARAYNELGILSMSEGIDDAEADARVGNAAKWFAEAAQRGSEDGAKNVLQHFLFHRARRSDRDLGAALEECQQLGVRGDARAAYLIGLAVETGVGVQPDLRGALAFYRRCPNGDLLAARAIARVGLTLGSDFDLGAVAAPLLDAAESGDGESCYYLAHMHRRGQGVDLDEARARTLMRRAAELGFALARDADAAFAAPRRKFHTAPPYATAFPVTD
jgi:TPR repeat protein